MKILSVDLGSRNLSWVVLSRTDDTNEKWSAIPFQKQNIKVFFWRNVDITVEAGIEEEINLNKTDIATCVPWFVATIHKYLDEMTDGVELAVLEAQPTSRVFSAGGKAISNVRTKVLSHILQAILLEKNIPVQFVSPSVKLRDAKCLMADVHDYKEHKKAAIVLTTKAVETIGGICEEIWKHKKGKKDDLADCLLQGICFKIKKIKTTKSKKRKIQKVEIPYPDEV